MAVTREETEAEVLRSPRPIDPDAPTIALVVPALETSWGVASVAEFILRTLREHSAYNVRLVSLAMSARDPVSLGLTAPATWLRGVATREGVWRGSPFVHVGAVFGELETQRYRPRRALTTALSGADLVQLVCGTPVWARPLQDLGIPVSMQVATLTAVERAAKLGSYGPVERLLRGAINRRVSAMETPAFRGCVSVQVENAWMRAHVEKVTRGADVEVLMGTPGVDAHRFAPPPSRPPSPGYILSVGRLQDPRKNRPLLLEAYGKLVGRVPLMPRLKLAGAGAPTPAFMRRASELGLLDMIDIHERPSDEELVDLYRGARAFALTSDEEGFGVAVVEAMSAGVPPVVTRSGGPDGIITDGDDGFLADCGDAETLADRLARVVVEDDLNAAMSAAARRTVEQRYTERVAGNVFLDLYRRLL